MRFGQNPRDFGEFSIREISLTCEAASVRDATQAWLAASYISFAFHAPKEMPEAPTMERPQGVSTEAEIAEAKAWMRSVSKVMHGS